MTSNPHESRELSVTLKCPESERYKQDGPWFVFKGSPDAIREEIATVFGLELEADAPLSDVVFAAQKIATASRNAASTLGARSTSSGKTASATPAPAAEPEAEKVDPLVAEITNLSDLTSHANCWADNKTRLQAEPEMLELWKNKGRELKAAA